MSKLLLIALLTFSTFSYAGTIQHGKATHYADKFNGRKTANGDRYNPRLFTAAHPTLPFGTKVRVSCSQTGREVIVTINDRGPYNRGYIIDLSRAAANRLGLTHLGAANVKVEKL